MNGYELIIILQIILIIFYQIDKFEKFNSAMSYYHMRLKKFKEFDNFTEFQYDFNDLLSLLYMMRYQRIISKRKYETYVDDVESYFSSIYNSDCEVHFNNVNLNV